MLTEGDSKTIDLPDIKNNGKKPKISSLEILITVFGITLN